MKTVLILSNGNSCRSQIAEGYLRFFAQHRAIIYSAGLDENKGLNPYAINTLTADGIDIGHHTSNLAEEYADMPFDYVITLCDAVQHRVPAFPGSPQHYHYNFRDPLQVTGTDGETIATFEDLRNEIKNYCKGFSKIHLSLVI